MLRKIARILTLLVCMVMVISMLSSCSTLGIKNPFHQHSWSAATFTAPETCKGCGETRGEAVDVFVWLKNYITSNGKYNDGAYELYIHGNSNSNPYVTLKFDYSSPDQIWFFVCGTTVENLTGIFGFVLSPEMNGNYFWSLMDIYGDSMYGTITASGFTKNTEMLSYTDSTFGSYNTQAKKIGASNLEIVLLAFNAYFEDEGLSAKNLGFTNFY